MSRVDGYTRADDADSAGAPVLVAVAALFVTLPMPVVALGDVGCDATARCCVFGVDDARGG